MASGYNHSGGISGRVGSEQAGEESSESDGEAEPDKSFRRRLSSSGEIKRAVSFVCRICIDHYRAGSVLMERKRRGLCLHTPEFHFYLSTQRLCFATYLWLHAFSVLYHKTFDKLLICVIFRT